MGLLALSIKSNNNGNMCMDGLDSNGETRQISHDGEIWVVVMESN